MKRGEIVRCIRSTGSHLTQDKHYVVVGVSACRRVGGRSAMAEEAQCAGGGYTIPEAMKTAAAR